MSKHCVCIMRRVSILFFFLKTTRAMLLLLSSRAIAQQFSATTTTKIRNQRLLEKEITTTQIILPKLFRLRNFANFGSSSNSSSSSQSSRRNSKRKPKTSLNEEKLQLAFEDKDSTTTTMKKETMTAVELKDEGNRYYTLHKYEDAINLYSQAINRSPSTPTFYTNRALCHLKLKNWQQSCEDSRRSLELDPNLIKGHFFLGLALLELANYDESIYHLQRALELSKENRRNYGDEITYQIRLARKKRWNALEEKRINEEIDLQSYLQRLIRNDRESQLEKLWSDVKNNQIQDEKVIQDLEQMINNACDERLMATNDLFAQVDDRRKKREIPDYLCGKISFEIMQDPVITPSGITYDRKDIEEHLQRVGHFDPVTRSPLTANQLTPNLAMKEVIDNFLADNEWANHY